MNLVKELNLDTENVFKDSKELMERNLPKIYDISIELIDDFPDHPFKVRMDEDMYKLVESIREQGQITPIILRPKGLGYEIISGHRRKKACEIVGLTHVKAIVREMTDDEAIVLMVESNLQRSEILPSEKAFSYKMRLEALKRMPGRPKKNVSPMENNSNGSTSSEVMAEDVGESKATIFRYIRLTELIPELLALVDEGKIAVRPAVELSYLTKDEQIMLLKLISERDCMPSQEQAVSIRESSGKCELTEDKVKEIMFEPKPERKPKLHIELDKLRAIAPNITSNNAETFILKALDFYLNHKPGPKPTIE